MVFSDARAFLSRNFLLIIILVIALFMRGQHLSQPFIDVFSWRQASTAMMAQNYFLNNWNIFYPEVNWTGVGPGYQGREFQTVSYLAAIAYQFFGQHDMIGRMIAISFGLWGIFALYQLVLLVWDKKHALAAATMMAILPGSAFTDRSFLPDPAMVSLTTTCMWLFVLYLYQEKTRYLVLAAMIGCLGILTKIPGLIIGLPMLYAFITLYKKRGVKDFPRLKPVLLTLALVLIPVVAYYLWARYLSLTYPPYHFAGSRNWIWNDWTAVFKEYFYFKNLKNIMEYWILGYPAIIFFILGLMLPLAADDESRKSKVPRFFHFLLLGCVLYYFIGASELINNPWNFQLFLPVISVFSGRLLVVLYNYGTAVDKVKQARLAFVILLMLAYNVRIMRDYLFETKFASDSHKLGTRLSSLKKPGDLVITIAEVIGDPVAIYYSGGKGWVFPLDIGLALSELPKDDPNLILALDDLKKQGADFFGIVDNHYQEIRREHPGLHAYLKSNMSMVNKTNDFVIFKWQ
ncbi:glycosyl transferase [Flavihumibacter sp. R14]|nr:glycosyl transferase [Flavihumibacter soli]